MDLRLRKLILTCRRSVEVQEFSEVTYLFGEIGSGKSTIARLVDYCLGSRKLVMTPALQSEFVSAELSLDIEGVSTSIFRERNSQRVTVSWTEDEEAQQVSVPVRRASGSVVPGTDVEVLSDLVFFIAGIAAPRVRRSQYREDSELERLSLRDMLWYCYLDQDDIDSSFFHLDREAENFRRLKSRNVLRLVLGVHQEKVAGLEVELEAARSERVRAKDAAEILQTTLDDAGFEPAIEIGGMVEGLDHRVAALEAERVEIRDSQETVRTHEADRLRNRARELAEELDAVGQARAELGRASENDRSHLAEIRSLVTKVNRVVRARSVLNAVEFQRCPRCTQVLEERQAPVCLVCGQIEPDFEESEESIAETRTDLADREKELEQMIELQDEQRRSLSRKALDLAQEKDRVDELLATVMSDYDSSYLARALGIERDLAEVQEERRYLERVRVLPKRVEELKAKAAALEVRERQLREALREARELAEQDTRHFRRLKALFLDCLVRTRIPGFEEAATISMDAPWFLPEALRGDSGDLVVTSFATLGSGGKKTLFKACFALALHRLAREVNAMLPSLLVIDSPMKNISERENRVQFEGFHSLVYDLVGRELLGTQIVIIDKELCAPPEHVGSRTLIRHMTLSEEENPPLISYYRG